MYLSVYFLMWVDSKFVQCYVKMLKVSCKCLWCRNCISLKSTICRIYNSVPWNSHLKTLFSAFLIRSIFVSMFCCSVGDQILRNLHAWMCPDPPKMCFCVPVLLVIRSYESFMRWCVLTPQNFGSLLSWFEVFLFSCSVADHRPQKLHALICTENAVLTHFECSTR